MANAKRMSITLSPEIIKKLEHIKKEKGKSSIADVVRDALSLYNFFYEEKNKHEDYGIFVGNPDKEEILKEVAII